MANTRSKYSGNSRRGNPNASRQARGNIVKIGSTTYADTAISKYGSAVSSLQTAKTQAAILAGLPAPKGFKKIKEAGNIGALITSAQNLASGARKTKVTAEKLKNKKPKFADHTYNSDDMSTMYWNIYFGGKLGKTDHQKEVDKANKAYQKKWKKLKKMYPPVSYTPAEAQLLQQYSKLTDKQKEVWRKQHPELAKKMYDNAVHNYVVDPTTATAATSVATFGFIRNNPNLEYIKDYTGSKNPRIKGITDDPELRNTYSGSVEGAGYVGDIVDPTVIIGGAGILLKGGKAVHATSTIPKVSRVNPGRVKTIGDGPLSIKQGPSVKSHTPGVKVKPETTVAGGKVAETGGKGVAASSDANKATPAVSKPETNKPSTPKKPAAKPKAEKPSSKPKDTKPVKEESKVNKPTKTEPVKEEPKVNEPTKTEPVKEEPKVNEPTKTEPVKEEPKVNEPTKTEPVKEEPKTNQTDKPNSNNTTTAKEMEKQTPETKTIKNNDTSVKETAATESKDNVIHVDFKKGKRISNENSIPESVADDVVQDNRIIAERANQQAEQQVLKATGTDGKGITDSYAYGMINNGIYAKTGTPVTNSRIIGETGAKSFKAEDDFAAQIKRADEDYFRKHGASDTSDYTTLVPEETIIRESEVLKTPEIETPKESLFDRFKSRVKGAQDDFKTSIKETHDEVKSQINKKKFDYDQAKAERAISNEETVDLSQHIIKEDTPHLTPEDEKLFDELMGKENNPSNLSDAMESNTSKIGELEKEVNKAGEELEKAQHAAYETKSIESIDANVDDIVQNHLEEMSKTYENKVINLNKEKATFENEFGISYDEVKELNELIDRRNALISRAREVKPGSRTGHGYPYRKNISDLDEKISKIKDKIIKKGEGADINTTIKESNSSIIDDSPAQKPTFKIVDNSSVNATQTMKEEAKGLYEEYKGIKEEIKDIDKQMGELRDSYRVEHDGNIAADVREPKNIIEKGLFGDSYASKMDMKGKYEELVKAKQEAEEKMKVFKQKEAEFEKVHNQTAADVYYRGQAETEIANAKVEISKLDEEIDKYCDALGYDSSKSSQSLIEQTQKDIKEIQEQIKTIKAEGYEVPEIVSMREKALKYNLDALEKREAQRGLLTEKEMIFEKTGGNVSDSVSEASNVVEMKRDIPNESYKEAATTEEELGSRGITEKEQDLGQLPEEHGEEMLLDESFLDDVKGLPNEEEMVQEAKNISDRKAVLNDKKRQLAVDNEMSPEEFGKKYVEATKEESQIAEDELKLYERIAEEKTSIKEDIIARESSKPTKKVETPTESKPVVESNIPTKEVETPSSETELTGSWGEIDESSDIWKNSRERTSEIRAQQDAIRRENTKSRRKI